MFSCQFRFRKSWEIVLDKIRISVVIPLYKGGKYAKIALESVLAQTVSVR